MPGNESCACSSKRSVDAMLVDTGFLTAATRLLVCRLSLFSVNSYVISLLSKMDKMITLSAINVLVLKSRTPRYVC